MIDDIRVALRTLPPMPGFSLASGLTRIRSGNRLMSVAVAPATAGLTFPPPRPVANVPRQQGFSTTFELAADGRFLMTRTPGHDYIALILNWPDELKRIEASGGGR